MDEDGNIIKANAKKDCANKDCNKDTCKPAEQELPETLDAHKLGLYYAPRYCSVCNLWKPPRSHHDSMTEKCVLRMDHYCPFTGNVIAVKNHGHFLLMYFFAAIALIYGLGLSALVLHTSYVNGPVAPPLEAKDLFELSWPTLYKIPLAPASAMSQLVESAAEIQSKKQEEKKRPIEERFAEFKEGELRKIRMLRETETGHAMEDEDFEKYRIETLQLDDKTLQRRFLLMDTAGGDAIQIPYLEEYFGLKLFVPDIVHGPGIVSFMITRMLNSIFSVVNLAGLKVFTLICLLIVGVLAVTGCGGPQFYFCATNITALEYNIANLNEYVEIFPQVFCPIGLYFYRQPTWWQNVKQILGDNWRMRILFPCFGKIDVTHAGYEMPCSVEAISQLQMRMLQWQDDSYDKTPEKTYDELGITPPQHMQNAAGNI